MLSEIQPHKFEIYTPAFSGVAGEVAAQRMLLCYLAALSAVDPTPTHEGLPILFTDEELALGVLERIQALAQTNGRGEVPVDSSVTFVLTDDINVGARNVQLFTEAAMATGYGLAS